MADTKLPDLPGEGGLVGGDLLYVVREGADAKAAVPVGGLAKLQGTQEFTGGQIAATTVLVSASNLTPINMALNNDFEITTAENSTLQNPTNAVRGQKGRIRIIQGATARTLAYGSNFRFPGGTVPALTATAGVTDVLYYDVLAPDRIAVNLVKGFAA